MARPEWPDPNGPVTRMAPISALGINPLRCARTDAPDALPRPPRFRRTGREKQRPIAGFQRRLEQLSIPSMSRWYLRERPALPWDGFSTTLVVRQPGSSP